MRGEHVSSIRESSHSSSIQKLDKLIDELEQLYQQYPPLDTGSRFGNPAFRDLHLAIVRNVERLHRDILHIQNVGAIEELSIYLSNSFGSEERLDYGSGHELNFAMWLLCLYQLHQIEETDFPVLVLHTFMRYLDLMRKIQSTYYLSLLGAMESGVWTTTSFCPSSLGQASWLATPTLPPKQYIMKSFWMKRETTTSI